MSKIRPKECQDVEFKRIWKDEYLKWICGFANAQGAVMYFGVDDDREVYGLKDSKRLLEDIPNKVVNYMGLVVDVNLYEQDGLDYIEMVIEPSNVAISYKGKYYYRSGSTMQELNGVGALADLRSHPDIRDMLVKMNQAAMVDRLPALVFFHSVKTSTLLFVISLFLRLFVCPCIICV